MALKNDGEMGGREGGRKENYIPHTVAFVGTTESGASRAVFG